MPYFNYRWDMTGLHIRCSAEDHENMISSDENLKPCNSFLVSNEYRKTYSPGGLCRS